MTKLFNIVQADRAYFGQKDAQQVVAIRRMVVDLDMPIRIVVCPTVREPDGLSMSSRNAYLDPAQRSAATVLFRALSAAKARCDAGERNAEAIRGAMRATLEQEPLAKTEYVSAAAPLTLRELDRVEGDVLLSLAARIGKTRLIDNFLKEGGAWFT